MLKISNFINILKQSKFIIVILNLMLFLFVFFVSEPIISAQQSSVYDDGVGDVVILHHGHNSVGSIEDMLTTDGLIRWLDDWDSLLGTYNYVPPHPESACEKGYPLIEGATSFPEGSSPSLGFFDKDPILLRTNGTRYHYGVLAKSLNPEDDNPANADYDDDGVVEDYKNYFAGTDHDEDRYHDYCHEYTYNDYDEDNENEDKKKFYDFGGKWPSQTECNVMKLIEGRYYVRPLEAEEDGSYTPFYMQIPRLGTDGCKIHRAKETELSEAEIDLQDPIYNHQDHYYEALLIGHSGGGVRSLAYAIDQRVKRSGNFFKGKFDNDYSWYEAEEDYNTYWDVAPLTKGIITIGSPMRGALVANNTKDQMISDVKNTHFSNVVPGAWSYLATVALQMVSVALSWTPKPPLVVILRSIVSSLGAFLAPLFEFIILLVGDQPTVIDAILSFLGTINFPIALSREINKVDRIVGEGIYGDLVGTKDLQPESKFYQEYLNEYRTKSEVKYKYCPVDGECTYFTYASALPPFSGNLPEFNSESYNDLEEAQIKLEGILEKTQEAIKKLDNFREMARNLLLDPEDIVGPTRGTHFDLLNANPLTEIYFTEENIICAVPVHEPGGCSIERLMCLNSGDEVISIRESLETIESMQGYINFANSISKESDLYNRLKKIETIIKPIIDEINSADGLAISFTALEQIIAEEGLLNKVYKRLVSDKSIKPTLGSVAIIYNNVIDQSNTDDYLNGIDYTESGSFYPHMNIIWNNYDILSSKGRPIVDDPPPEAWPVRDVSLPWALQLLENNQFQNLSDKINEVEITDEDISDLDELSYLLLSADDAPENLSEPTVDFSGVIEKPLADVYYASISGGKSDFFTMANQESTITTLKTLNYILGAVGLATMISETWYMATQATNISHTIASILVLTSAGIQICFNIASIANLGINKDFTGSGWPTDSFVNSDSSIFPAELLGGQSMTGNSLTITGDTDDNDKFQEMVNEVYPGLDIKDHYHFKDLVHGFNEEEGLDRNVDDVMFRVKKLVEGYEEEITDERGGNGNG